MKKILFSPVVPLALAFIAVCSFAAYSVPEPKTYHLTGVVKDCDRGRATVLLTDGRLIVAYPEVGCKTFSEGGTYDFDLRIYHMENIRKVATVK